MILSTFALLCLTGYVLLLIMAVYLLSRGIRGRVTFSDPTCARCGYDLRWVNPSVNTTCPECGSDLTAAHAVRFAARRRSPRMIWAGLTVLLLCFAAVPASKFLLMRSSMSGSKTNLPTSTLIANLSSTADQPWDWRELERRLGTGQLSNQECAAAIEQLIKFIQNSATGWNRPLVWCDGFVKKVDTRGAISKGQFEQLARAFFNAEPKVQVRGKLRQGRPIRFELSGASPWPLLEHGLVYAIRGAHVDKDQPAELLDRDTLYHEDSGTYVPTQQEPSRSERMEKLSQRAPFEIEGGLLAQISPGKHTITLEVDYGVVPRNATFYTGLPGQAKSWPKLRCQWTSTVTVPIEILPSSTSRIQLVTQPELDPTKRISAWAALNASRTPGKLALRVMLSGGSLPTPILCRVAISMDGKTQGIGNWHWTEGTADMLGTEFPQVSADVKTCTITLRPAPDRAEGRKELDRIWGKEIVLNDVPVRREDLEDAAAEANAGSAPSHP